MAGGMKFRDFRTNTEVEAKTEKEARILEQGGYVRVTANTPALNKPTAEPSTVAEHVAAAKQAEAAKAQPDVTEPADTVVAAVETVEEPDTRPANAGRKGKDNG